MNPSKFTRIHDPLIAQGWIKDMDIIFKVTPCTDEEKFVFATHMLRGAVERQLDGTTICMDASSILKDWENSQAIFLDN